MRVLVCNLGTPAEPTAEAVRAFLAEFLGDPFVVDWPRIFWWPILHGIVLRKRPARVAEMYRSIWGSEGSPLAVGTERIVRGLQAGLGGDYQVEAAYRYGRPSIEEAIRSNPEAPESPPLAPGSLIVPLFPQRTGPTTGTIEALVRRPGRTGEPVPILEISPDDPGYVEALSARYRDAVGVEPPEHLVISFHGIPMRYDRREGGRYQEDCERTAHALVRMLGLDPSAVTHSYQSKFGPGRWLEPATDRVLLELPGRGIRSVAVITPGFLTDGLETLEEIGIRGSESFLGSGGDRFVRVGAVEDHPAFVASLAERIRAWHP